MRNMTIVTAKFKCIVLVCAAALAACGRDNQSSVKTPATAPAGPRVVSTVPAATMNLMLINALDHVVGVSTYDQLFLPEEKRNLPVVGDYESMNYEQLIALSPTALVIQQAPSRISPRLKEVAAAHNIELANMTFNHVEDIWESVRTLGRISGHEKDASEAIDKAQHELQELKILYGGKDVVRPKVLFLASPQLMLIAGKNTFIDEMITLAGGENAGAQAGNDFLEVGREAIVKLAPEVLIVDISEQPPPQGEMADDPRLQTWLKLPIPAARNKRVYLLTDGNALMASVAIGRNVRMLAGLIHEKDAPATAPAPPATSAPGGAGGAGGAGGMP
jgi:iron complex transport system substrate-binding protein